MKLSTKITKFQDGGQAPQGGDPSQGAQGGAPDPSQGGDASQQQQDPVAQLVQMAQQALQSKDCQAALAVCDGLLQVLSQAQQGGQQGGQPGGGQGQQGAPTYKRGGVLVRRS